MILQNVTDMMVYIGTQQELKTEIFIKSKTNQKRRFEKGTKKKYKNGLKEVFILDR